MTMSPGALARRLLGDRAFRVAGRTYRAVFVDLDHQVRTLATEIPVGAHVLDVGGGDGEPLDRLLALRPDIRVTTIDITSRVGGWIAALHDARVERYPETTLERYLQASDRSADVLLLADVMHHVPPAIRPMFVSGIAELFRRQPTMRLIVKDVEPGHWRATLGYLSDRYITGDRDVAPISRSDLIELLTAGLAPLRWRETALFQQDAPNYALVFERPTSDDRLPEGCRC
jgi:hypothetical protein